MLSYDLAHWTTFGLAALVLNLAPGPDFAFILGHTARGGVRAGFAAMFGIWTGALGHVLLAALGLSALVAASALAFSVVKWVGVAYLVFLGIQALRSKGGAYLADGKTTAQPIGRVFRQGIFVNLLNPKVALFFLAFLPQFVEPGAGPTGLQLAVHGLLIIAIAAVVEPTLILVGDRLTTRLRASTRLGLWLDRAMGGLFLSLGIRLALEDR